MPRLRFHPLWPPRTPGGSKPRGRLETHSVSCGSLQSFYRRSARPARLAGTHQSDLFTDPTPDRLAFLNDRHRRTPMATH